MRDCAPPSIEISPDGPRGVLSIRMTVTDEVFVALIAILRHGSAVSPQYGHMLEFGLLEARYKADEQRARSRSAHRAARLRDGREGCSAAKGGGVGWRVWKAFSMTNRYQDAAEIRAKVLQSIDNDDKTFREIAQAAGVRFDVVMGLGLDPEHVAVCVDCLGAGELISTEHGRRACAKCAGKGMTPA